jgi:hypothetical protein
MFEIVGIEGDHVSAGDEPWGVGEEVVHFLERTLLRLREEGPEEEGVSEIADLFIVSVIFFLGRKWRETHDEEIVVSVAHILHSLISNLTNHSIERETSHRCNGNAFRSRLRVKHLHKYH